MLNKRNILLQRMRSLSLRAFSYFDNNGNINFTTNGEEIFVKKMFAYFHKIGQDNLVLFDIGANSGNYAQILLSCIADNRFKAQLHIFEPVHSNFVLLNENFSQKSNVFVHKKAVSNKQGAAPIFYPQSGSQLASLYNRDLGKHSFEEYEIIEKIRLDSYIDEKSIKRINFLKIDVEGHEMAVIEGLGSYLSHHFIDFIQFEYGGTYLDSRTNLKEIYSAFNKSGFSVAKVMQHGLEVRTYQSWMDNFQYANYVAISNQILGKI